MPARDPRTRRYPCAWCAEPDMWPDLCVETSDGLDGCIAMIEKQCTLGDHRRCSPRACAAAASWHDRVRRAGIAAAEEAGTIWAVVSTLEDRVQVVGTVNHLGQAKSIIRGGLLTRAGLGVTPEGIGMVYVVRVTDGGFF